VSLSLPGQAVTAHPVAVQRPSAIPGTLPEEVTQTAVNQPSPQLLPPPPGAGSMQRQPGQQPEVRPTFPTPPNTNPSGIQPVQNIVTQSRSTDSDISLELPGPQRIFGRLDNEAAWQERVRQEARDKSTPDRNVTFPDEVTLTTAPYTGRNWPRQMTYVEPNYLVYRRLYFQELNSERYGWDLGPLSPVVSTLYFYKDTLMFPYNFGSDICRRFETNAGYCLPGDPVPYMLYPPGASLTGAGTEATALLILLAAFP
jgi:hypothetical protein